MSIFFDDIQNILHEAVGRYGSIRKLAETVDMNPSTISKWLETDTRRPQRSPNLRELAPVMDLMGVRLTIQVGNIEKAAAPATTDGGSDINELKRQLANSEAERQSLAGEVRALERQLARLMPAPVTPSPASGEKEPQSSALKTANG